MMVVPPPDPVKLLKAAADPTRYKALKEMAGGESFSVVSLAWIFRMHQDTMGKHLKVLFEAGAVARVQPPGADRRLQIYEVPGRYRRLAEDGRPLIDYGVCVLRF
jgi:DNA-binding transcriptional ArsR family regulator